MLYLLNSATLFANGCYCMSGPLELQTARSISADGFESAIGHQATAQWLGELLGHPVPMQRRCMEMQPGDKAIVYRLLPRLSEGQVIDLATLKKLPYQLNLLVREN